MLRGTGPGIKSKRTLLAIAIHQDMRLVASRLLDAGADATTPLCGPTKASAAMNAAEHLKYFNENGGVGYGRSSV